jgi:hypothetical protein
MAARRRTVIDVVFVFALLDLSNLDYTKRYCRSEHRRQCTEAFLSLSKEDVQV